MLDLDPSREPVRPKDAATVVVVREAGPGIEVFCVKRHARSGFMGGAVVFPGGKVDESDRAEQWAARATPLSARALALAESESDARGFAIAALRELCEEAAILPVVGGALDTEAMLALREQLSETRFLDLIEQRQLALDAALLEPLSRWITPRAESRRYDTRFYLLPLPERQSGKHDERETTTSFWARPGEVLEMWTRGEIFLAPPTCRTLEVLSPASSIQAALELARAHPLQPVCPHFAQDGDAVVLALPGDPLYPEPHPAPADPSAPTRFVLEDGRFVPRRCA